MSFKSLPILLLAIFVSMRSLSAHPTAFKDAIVFDAMNSPGMSAFNLHYSLTHRFSLGVHGMRSNLSENHGGHLDPYRHYTLTSYTGLLVKRWNHEKFQANSYVYGGIGATRSQGESKPAFFFCSQADIEDRRLYAMGKFETMQFLKFNDLYTYTGRLGLAPYQGEAGEIHTWFMGQYDYKPHDQKKHDFSPIVRLFYKTVLIEAGASFRGDYKLNLMFHY